ncbi:hypothetical protein CONPUDRAFT_135404 [Coniophora puteana RWD-64-598 SS2]|uniref:Uncharacterized protein n=1 Tax=Coniophora puteana (strain RWD-64-598) TaxID=741705 RepID=A0A5M3MWQ8_CONPW|nr:uncharacterized protein CONPUDRAFT_135404 [Coniophora puteana RWD-64-598 SS2]EIW83583.1 hypothetical protein CONPUDRAFT_135404 [Coniophora puteana RWD-64-598 SS2]
MFEVCSLIEAISLICSECLFFLRTYIMWNCQRRILYIILSLILIGLVPLMVLIAIFVFTVTFVASPVSSLDGCTAVKEPSNILPSAFVILLVVELAISGLIGIRLIRDRPHLGLLKTLMSGGAIYCFCMTLFSVANLVTASVPGVTMNMLDNYQATFHSILASRLQLNLASSQELDLPCTDTIISSLQFQRRSMNRTESYELENRTEES